MNTNVNPNLNQVTEITLQYRPKVSSAQRLSVSSAEEAYKIFFNNWNTDTIQLQEEFKVMLLNRSNKVLGIVTTSIGGMNATVVDPKFIFGVALKGAASSIIVAHNHPSGNLKPSFQDKVLTRKIVELGKLLQVEMLDHIIVTSDSYYSFAEEGNL